MDFEWDEAKRSGNLAKHGIDFLLVTRLFDGRPVITRGTPRGGEARHLTVGIIGDDCVAVIWTERENARRLISARRARDEEKSAYRSIHGKRD